MASSRYGVLGAAAALAAGGRGRMRLCCVRRALHGAGRKCSAWERGTSIWGAMEDWAYALRINRGFRRNERLELP